jgi:nitroreductase
MNVKEAISKRRAYRSLKPVEITKDLVRDLAECAKLSASCFNNQPWRYIFVYDPKKLKEMHLALSSGNEWAKTASMIITVFSKTQDDCVIHDRQYYLFDTGMATAFIILRVTELGLVAHPIAGYSPRKVREILGIPDTMNVIALIIVGKHSEKISPILSNSQIEAEQRRPERMPLKKFVYMNKYG